ncbi:MAG TPA: DUF885 domain-containing protein [Verrucomicrobiae bacterium]|nr:DUF885 domain-containing protein [Verrucomicrobiae bacterium]
MDDTYRPPGCIGSAARRRATYFGRLFFAFLLQIAAVAGAATTADDNLNAFFKDYLEERFRQQPLDATRLGDHRFDHLLDDISAEARARWLASARSALKNLSRKVMFKELSRDGQIDFEIFQTDLKAQIWNLENRKPFAEDPRVYGSYINESIYLLLVQSTLPTETNIANSIARIREIPRIISEAKKSLARPPKTVLETAVRQNRGAIGFFETEIFTLAGDTPQREELKSAIQPALVAIRDFQNFLEGELMDRATGEWRLGRRKFNQKFALETDAGVSAEQTLADAEAEFERVRRDMYVVCRQLWSRYFSKSPLPPDDAEGRRTTIMRVVHAVSQEHGKPENLLKDAQATVASIRNFIRDHNILRLPEPDRCQVIEMPEFRRGNSLAYLENAPPLDPGADSFYAISPPPADWGPERVKSFLEEYNEHMLQILTIHEAYPGHYVQLEYANRAASLIRRVLMSGVMVEGWAVYTEQMMLDQGYGGGDLRLRLMQLKFYLRAVVNAILDQRMHCEGMTDEEAMDLMVKGAFQSEGEARLKVIRAKQSSVQLSTYFVGRMAHYRLRQNLQRQLGEQFDLGRFHEAVMAHGSVPVKYLPELVGRQLSLTQ